MVLPAEIGAIKTRLSVLACGAAILAGCSTAPTRPVFVETPLPLIAGATLVTPVHADPDAWEAGDDTGPPPLLLGDGQRIETSAARYVPSVMGDRTHGWLGPPRTWRRAFSPADGASTLLLAPVPAGGLGQSVWMEGRRVPAFWIVPTLGDPEQPSPPSLGAIASRAEALDLVDGELSDPTIRWRAELALARLGYEAPPPPWRDPVLDAWAAQSGERWNAAWRVLHEIDPELADRLAESLTRWVATPQWVQPIWPTDAQAINSLILSILRPGASGESVRRAVLAFLDRQPQWLAWVANDAGGVVGGAIAVVNLSSSPALLSTRPSGGQWEAHGMLEPATPTLISIPPDRDARSPVAVWQVRLGGRTTALEITTNAIELGPPGLAIGPFWRDWTLEGLKAGTAWAPAPDRDGWIGGIIQQDTRQNAPDSSESGWVVYIEVRRPPCDLPAAGERAAARDAVRVAFGPTNNPHARVTVRCTGLTSFGQGQDGPAAILTRSKDRWAFTLPIDRAWMEPDGTILVGAQFLPHDGPRATWPRPLLPGQDAIGRVRVDPSAWALRSAAVDEPPAP